MRTPFRKLSAILTCLTIWNLNRGALAGVSTQAGLLRVVGCFLLQRPRISGHGEHDDQNRCRQYGIPIS